MFDLGSRKSFLATQQEFLGRSEFPELEFFEPSLEDATPDKVEAPKIETELLPRLRRFRLIVLAGRRGSEKLLFAKQLAWQLSKEIRNEGEECAVRQWHPNSSLVHISSALDRQKEPTIFLFPGLQPHQLGGYDLRRLLEDLGRHPHYAILTTESELEQWSPSAEQVEEGVWLRVESTLITRAFLVDTLILRLQELGDRLPGDLPERVERLEPESCLTGDLRIEELARRLGSPGRIRSFAVALSLESEISQARLLELVEGLLDERHAIHQWFRSLSARDQTLSLSLALLDGLLDDQVFAAIELLVQHSWRHWDPLLAHFDYHELEQVGTYFQGFDGTARASRIECLSQTCRESIFDIGWLLYRRRILATLPVMAEMIKDSQKVSPLATLSREEKSESHNENSEVEGSEVSEPPPIEEQSADRPELSDEQTQASRWHRHGRWRELFGSRTRNGLLHHSLAGALSHIARISVSAVEPTLLDLASEDKQHVQLVVADALARWRELDPGEVGDKRLFQLLAAWQNEAYQKELAQQRVFRRRAAEPFARIRATIALTLSRASLYDPPNNLAEPLVRLFERLVRDRSPIVRERFRIETIPLLVQKHLMQLEGILWDRVVPEVDLLVGTAVGMAGAHGLRSDETRPILDSWLRRAQAIPDADEDDPEYRQRAHALAIIALAYGLLKPGSGAGAFSESEIFGLLGGLLAGEENRLVRTAALSAVLQQATSNLEAVAPLIQEAICEIDLEERDLIVDHMTELYLEQRLDLDKLSGNSEGSSAKNPSPDQRETIAGKTYPLWIETQRPPTPLERVLNDWLSDPDQPVALQVAMQCLESFAETPLARREHQLREDYEKTEEMEAAESSSVSDSVSTPVLIRKLSPAGHLAVALASPSPFNGERRSILRLALAEVFQSRKRPDNKRRELLKEIWNGGAPEWQELARKENLAVLLDIPKVDDHPMLKQLANSWSPEEWDLAKYLGRAGWIHALRWPLFALTTVLISIVSLLSWVLA